MTVARILALLTISLTTVQTHAQTPPIVTHARRLLEQQPTLERAIGLAELERAYGLRDASIERLHDLAKTNARSAELHELLCWRMLPVVPAQREAFRRHVVTLQSLQPDHPWRAIWDLYLLSGEGDRNAFFEAACKLPAGLPDRFPARFAESAHAKLLQESGLTKVQAGVEVVAGRSFDALHALRDLDRALSREADYLRSVQRDSDADRLIQVRNRCRTAYEKAARHLVERLFALHLRQANQERDALLARARALPFLHDRNRLASLLDRLDQEQAWKLLIEPLLTSELALIENPPDFAKLQSRSIARVHITSQRKSVQGDTTHYTDARFQLGAIDGRCKQMTVVRHDDPASVIMTGNGAVELRGLPTYPGGVDADRFAYHAETGAFSLGGDVRLVAHDKTIKLRACTLTQRGELRDARSLIDDFRARFTVDAKLELLPAITRIYTDDELPDDVRFLLALNLLRPHLSWHAPFLPAPPDRDSKSELVKLVQKVVGRDFYLSAWQEALTGENWMHADVGPEVEATFRASLRAWYQGLTENPRTKTLIDIPIPGKDLSFWRIGKPDHPDIARAKRLLQGISTSDLAAKAYRWRSELERNNTVITFDIAGAAPLGKAHSLLMDVRNAERVRFKLYRVQRAEELLYATRKIGTDFVYRDHRLDDARLTKVAEDMKHAKDVVSKSKSSRKELMPIWRPEQLVREWYAKVAELKAFRGSRHERRHWRSWQRDDWYHEPDADYFDDECLEHQARLRKEYRPYNDDQLSSWQFERIVTIPEKVLAEAGAYVLIAEANGQVAHVPIVVEPVSLTLRRCRDGVFVQVGDAAMKKPLVGAKVYALDLENPAVTDREGVAFARTLALGDRAIVVAHEGRYAIGGFGAVFEGLYDHDDDDDELQDKLMRARRDRQAKAGKAYGHMYADRHVVVAYTDRPTYRPGQEIHFKLIVRKLLGDKSGEPSTTFRGDEFDRPTKFELPALDQPIEYAVLDPKGRAIETGTLTLSEFGSAAGKVTLNSETVLGSYSLRVRIAGQPRIVPDAFAVKHYRRPNFEVDLTGVPEKLSKPQTLPLAIASRYYFGPPVAAGSVNVRLMRVSDGRPIVEERATLDANGKAKLELRVPRSLEPGRYVVVCSVIDESGRSVSKAAPLTLEIEGQASTGLAGLPRFVPVGKELAFTTGAKEVRATQHITSLTFPAKNGRITLTLPAPGWYTIKAGDDETEIFAYGGKEHPRTYADHADRAADDELLPRVRWVNLSDYSLEENGELSRWERPSQHLYALFDKHNVTLGDKLRLLVYVPHKNAKLLFTMEGRTILDYAVVSLEGDGPYRVVEVPIKERHYPNFYLQGRILRHDRVPRAEGRAGVKLQEQLMKQLEEEYEELDPRWCRVDVVRPKGKEATAPLQVTIETDQAQYRPGDMVRATIKVADRDGRPQAAELSLAAVDESVYVFGEDNLDALPSFFRTPQETRRFLPKPWRVSIGEHWSKTAQAQQQAMAKAMDLMKAMKDAVSKQELSHIERHFTAVPLSRLGGQLPSREIPLARLREDFRETSTWLPQLRTDADGIARAAFALPDSLTRYRLSAVALTKTTDLGVGRARINAALPLAVQVFVPRFAVEKDRLHAVAVIHNTTDRARECEFKWDIDDAGVDGPLTGRVKVSAKGSTKVTLPLTFSQVGVVKIACSVLDGKDGDKELRTLPVQALGREQNVAANQQLVKADQPAAKEVFGKFNKQGRIELPKGFTAREIHLSLAVSDVAQALDGLDYLIDYPYGCIEQTMSRFLPVVTIKHASLHSPVALRADIAAKLPDILDKGLTRLYSHQHPDGSWGWFEKDGRNLAMSTYVVYGLARCQTSGTKVDAEVMRRGCQYLKEELTKQHGAELTARTWYALALAGHADVKELEKIALAEAKQTERDQPLVWCNLALACRAAGLNEAGERLWAKVRARLRNSWWGHDTESFALILNTQLAYGAPYQECRVMAERILQRRSGAHWYHTRDTSWAIEALAGLLAYTPDKNVARKIEVTIGGQKVQTGKQAGGGKELIYRLHLKGDQIPSDDGLQIVMNVDGNEAIQVAFRAVGVQRLDDLQATGTHVRVQRAMETLDGAPLKGPLKIGQVVRVRLKLDLTRDFDYVLLEERRPSLCEFADDHLSGAAAVHQEFRDDRLCVFFRALPAGAHEIVYYLRAETVGSCSVLPGCAYPMYDEKVRGETGGGKLEVK